MGDIAKFCPMCGATPGEPCTPLSPPGDVRPEPHFYRHNDRPIAVLIRDEPPYVVR